jgi:glycosyltransferase involved in cell wall biosynthesis
MINFSIIFPTRERPKLLSALLRTIETTTSEKDKIEVLVVYDDDDRETDKTVEIFEEFYRDIKLRFYRVERSRNFSRDYYSFLAKKSKGRYVWAINDDAEFWTQGWDKIVLLKAEEYLRDKPDRVVYIKVSDETHGEGATCFPILSKESVEALGHFFNPLYPTWSADLKLYTVFVHKDVDRVLDLSQDVFLGHNSPHNERRERDNTFEHSLNIFKTEKIEQPKDYIAPHTFLVRCIKKKRPLTNEYMREVLRRYTRRQNNTRINKYGFVIGEYRQIGDALVTNPRIGVKNA